jgi:hypothetical protein
MENARIRLIARADDCASSRTANEAILAAYRNGLVRNVSVMVPCSFIEEAAEMFAGEKGLCIGLHATLNAEWDHIRWGPVLPPEQVPSLVAKDGTFFKTTKELHENRPNISEIMAELQAQLDKGRQLGFDFKYVDSHMFFEWVVPGLDEQIERWAAREGLLYHMHYQKPLPRAATSGEPADRLIAGLEAAEPGQYLFVGHPAYDTEEMRRHGNANETGAQVARNRNGERLAFMDPRVLEYCRRNGVVPIRYDEAERLK